MRRLLDTRPLAALLLVWIAVAGPVEAQERDDTPETRLVQINLLAASKQGTSELSDLPVNTRKAIEDIQDFLPFKSYRILDTSLVRTAVTIPSRGGTRARTFMTGPDGSKLQVTMRITAEKGSDQLFVNLFEVSPSAMERFRPVLAPEQGRPHEPENAPPAVAPRADLLDLGSLISTSFSADIGKTVVVGSSRLNGGDDALIVLFTALP